MVGQFPFILTQMRPKHNVGTLPLNVPFLFDFVWKKYYNMSRAVSLSAPADFFCRVCYHSSSVALLICKSYIYVGQILKESTESEGKCPVPSRCTTVPCRKESAFWADSSSWRHRSSQGGEKPRHQLGPLDWADLREERERRETTFSWNCQGNCNFLKWEEILDGNFFLIHLSYIFFKLIMLFILINNHYAIMIPNRIYDNSLISSDRQTTQKFPQQPPKSPGYWFVQIGVQPRSTYCIWLSVWSHFCFKQSPSLFFYHNLALLKNFNRACFNSFLQIPKKYGKGLSFDKADWWDMVGIRPCFMPLSISSPISTLTKRANSLLYIKLQQ